MRLDADLTNGTLTLCGRVPTDYLKQLVQSMAVALPGIDHVVNQIEVVTLSVRPTRL